MVSTVGIAMAAEEVAKAYERGWAWWAWPIAWAALAACGLFMALALPVIAFAWEGLEDSAWKWPATVGIAAAGIAAVVFGWVGPGVLMRHQDSGGGAFWVFLGALVVAGFAWYWAGAFLGSRNRYQEPHIATKFPGMVLAGGAVFGGVAEVVTRAAAAIPMGTGQFLAIVLIVVIVIVIKARQ